MIKSRYMNISPKEYEVMLALFEYRGATIDQLLKILGYNRTGLTNMYKPIQSLTKLGYISAYVISPKRSKKIYYLSPKGYSTMVEHLDIPPDYIGSGYNKDYGDFKYELYKPPSKLKVHQLYLVDFLITANNFKKEIERHNKTNSFDFRDNRYASREFKVLIEEEGAKPYTRTKHFRPDAEIKILSNNCFIEIDLGTEREFHLKEKFERYKTYFDYLIATKQNLPSSIIFISEEMQTDVQKNRRWHAISNSFLEILSEYAPKVNLIYETIENAQEVLVREYLTEDNRKKTNAKIINYLHPNGLKLYFINQELNFKHGKVSFSYSDNNTFYPYERGEGFETKGWALLWEYKKFAENEGDSLDAFKNVKKIVPVFYYKDIPPQPIAYFKKMDKDGFFENRLLFKTKGQSGIWQDKNLNLIEENPIIK